MHALLALVFLDASAAADCLPVVTTMVTLALAVRAETREGGARRRRGGRVPSAG